MHACMHTYADARQQLKSGQAEAAVTTYLHLLKKDPHYSPPVLAVHQTHLALQHPWAAAAYLVAATFQLDKVTHHVCVCVS